MKNNGIRISTSLLLVFTVMIMQSCAEPSFAEETPPDGNLHGTTVGTFPEDTVIPVGFDIEAWLEDDHLPEEILKDENVHFCETENDW